MKRSDEKTFKKFLEKYDTAPPEQPPHEFARIQGMIQERGKNKLWFAVLFWGPVAMGLTALIAFFIVGKNHLNSQEPTDIADAQLIWESFQYVDELDEDLDW